MIELLLHCEAVEDTRVCENNETVQLPEGSVRLENGAIVIEGVAARLPEGWSTETERGCPRLRCERCGPQPEESA